MARTKHNVPVKRVGAKGSAGASKSIASTLVGKNKKAAVKSPRNAVLHEEVTTKKAYRRRPGTKVNQEIRKQQRDSHKKRAFPTASLNRLIREVGSNVSTERKYEVEGIGCRWEAKGLDALSEAVEYLHSEIFRWAQFLARHAGRVTIMKTDIMIAIRIVSKPLAESYKHAHNIPTGIPTAEETKSRGHVNKSVASRLAKPLFKRTQ